MVIPYSQHVSDFVKIAIRKKQQALWYSLNKDKVRKAHQKRYRKDPKKLNAKRKQYKRQSWAERADNPKNKLISS